MICRFFKKIFCCFLLDTTDEDDVYNALHNDANLTEEDVRVTSPSPSQSSFDNNNRYNLSDEPDVSYHQIYHIYYR
jgi:hypothetical protein